MQFVIAFLTTMIIAYPLIRIKKCFMVTKTQLEKEPISSGLVLAICNQHKSQQMKDLRGNFDRKSADEKQNDWI